MSAINIALGANTTINIMARNSFVGRFTTPTGYPMRSSRKVPPEAIPTAKVLLIIDHIIAEGLK